MSSHSRSVFSLMVLLAVVTLTAPLSAQNRVPPAWTQGARTTIAIPENFPDIDARSIIIREPGREVVLLRETDASAETLMMSLSVLQDARQRDPAPTLGEMIPITGFVVTNPASPGYERRLLRALERLQAAEVADMGSLGMGRWVPLQGR